MKHHKYNCSLTWKGNRGKGTKSYRSYDRAFEILIPSKPIIAGSSDPAFLGDPTKHNPEELLVASLSSCHMLWYLHLCAIAGVVVESYSDTAEGTMVEEADGSGRFTSVILRPTVLVSSQDQLHLASQLHEDAHRKCFIANSVNFPVVCEHSIDIFD